MRSLVPVLIAASISAAPVAAQTASNLPGVPHQVKLTCPMTDGTSFCTVALPPTVGKRIFLIQTVSAYRLSTTGALEVFVGPRFEGVTTYFSLPPLVSSGTSYPTATLSAPIFSDKNGGVINVYRSSATGTDTVYIGLSGYLITPAT